MLKPLAITVALTATVAMTVVPQTAEACSYAAAEWTLLHRGNTLVLPAGGPVVVTVIGYDNPIEDLPAIDESTFTLELRDGEGAELSGTVEVHEGAGENTARLVLTPDEALVAGGAYELTILRDGDATPTVLPLDVLESAGEPTPLIGELLASEVRQDAATQCCETDEEDFACRMDDCGDFEFGEACKLCWATAYEYPVRATVTWDVGSDVPRSYLSYRVSRIDDGEEVIAERLGIDQATALWPADFAGPYCLRIEVTDVIRDVTASEEVCTESGDVETVEREEPDPAAFIDRCVPGTIDDEPDTPGPDPDPEDDPEQDGDTDRKSDPGGCNTANSPVAPTLVLLLLALFGLRRVARSDER